jgi:hypothetical protein
VTIETNTRLSPGQTARMTGVRKSTLSRAVEGGQLSATRTESGGDRFEPCELERAGFPLAPGAIAGATDATTDTARPETTLDATLVALLREQLADTRAERDRWRGVAERLTTLLPVAQRQADQAAEAAEAAEAAMALVRRPWWRRLAG